MKLDYARAPRRIYEAKSTFPSCFNLCRLRAGKTTGERATVNLSGRPRQPPASESKMLRKANKKTEYNG